VLSSSGTVIFNQAIEILYKNDFVHYGMGGPERVPGCGGI